MDYSFVCNWFCKPKRFFKHGMPYFQGLGLKPRNTKILISKKNVLQPWTAVQEEKAAKEAAEAELAAANEASVTALARLREVLQQERAQEAALRASAESKVEQLQQQVSSLYGYYSYPVKETRTVAWLLLPLRLTEFKVEQQQVHITVCPSIIPSPETARVLPFLAVPLDRMGRGAQLLPCPRLVWLSDT